MGANLFSPLFTEQDFFWKEAPQFFVGGSLLKGLGFGLVWPSIPIKLVTQPRDLYVFGHGMNRWRNEVGDEFRKAAEEFKER